MSQKLTVTTPTDTTIRFERILAAPRDRVFHAYSDADMMKQWFADPANPVTAVESDPREGGAYMISWSGENGDMVMRGIYTRFVRPEQVSSTETWEPDWTEGEVTNDATFEDMAGATRLVLVSTYTSAKGRDGALQGASDGFAACLDALEALLSADG